VRLYFRAMDEHPNPAVVRFLYGIQVCIVPEQFTTVEEIEDYLAS
jgi:hypothetical protein